MRAVLFAVLFTFGCSSNKENANPSPSASAPTSDRRADDRATEAEESRNVAKVEAATAKEAADVKLTAAHDETAARLQKEFDSADRRFTALKERAAKATGEKKKQADAAVATVTTHEASVMAGLAKLRDVSGAEWDTTKTKIDADSVALGQAIESLDRTLQ